jgi:hypothetical protein
VITTAGKKALLTFTIIDNFPQINVAEPVLDRIWSVEVEVEAVQNPTILRVTVEHEPERHPDLTAQLVKEASDLHYGRAVSLLLGARKRKDDFDEADAAVKAPDDAAAAAANGTAKRVRIE